MVDGLNAGKLARHCVVGVIAFLVAIPAAATVEEGRSLIEQHQTALEKRQAAAAQGDAEAYEQLGDEVDVLLKKARLAFEEADAPNSNDPAVLRDYAGVLRKMGYDDLASEALKAAFDRGVVDAGLWRMYGESLLAIGPNHFQDGVDALHHALSLDDSSAEAARIWSALGKYYLESEMPEPAGTAFAAALAIDPAYVPARLGDATVKVYAGDVAGAGDIIEAVGREAQPYDTMLRALMRTALMDFDRVRRTFDDTAKNHYAYARLLYMSSRLPEAVLAARRATYLAPDRMEIWNFLGAIQMQMGDYAGALEAYQGSLRVNAEQPGVQQTVEQLKQAVAEAAAQQPAPAPDQALPQGQGPLR